jgi:hypothetical protein
MRVVQVIARLNVGGPAALVLSVAEGAPFEFEVKVLAGEVQAGEADHRDVRGASVAVLTVPGLGRSIRPADDFRALAHLYRSLRALRPDIVHTHTAKAGVLGRAVALASGGSRLVHTFHGHLLYG